MWAEAGDAWNILGLTTGIWRIYPWTQLLIFSGAFSKPTIKVMPSNVVTIGQQVTIFCEGSLHAKEYRLHKEGSEDYLTPTTLLETENKAKFSISPIQWNHAGQYWCSYKSPTNMSQQSDMMELVVTGEKTLPILQDLPWGKDYVHWGLPFLNLRRG